MPRCERGGARFESGRSTHVPEAKAVEAPACKAGLVGSTPTGHFVLFVDDQISERLSSCDPLRRGSPP